MKVFTYTSFEVFKFENVKLLVNAQWAIGLICQDLKSYLWCKGWGGELPCAIFCLIVLPSINGANNNHKVEEAGSHIISLVLDREDVSSKKVAPISTRCWCWCWFAWSVLLILIPMPVLNADSGHLYCYQCNSKKNIDQDITPFFNDSMNHIDLFNNSGAWHWGLTHLTMVDRRKNAADK